MIVIDDSFDNRKDSQLAVFSSYTMSLFGYVFFLALRFFSYVPLSEGYDNQVTKVDTMGRGSIGI